MTRYLVSAAALALMSSVAMAADIPMEPAAEVAPVPAGYDWSGLYAGAFAGYGWADIDVTDEDGYNGSDGDGDFGYDADDFYFGSLFGYNFQSGHFVFGVEGELGRLEIEEDQQFPDFEDDPTREGDSVASVDIDTFGNVSGRLGFAWDNIMPYVKGGLAFADVEVRYDDPNTSGATLVSGTDEDDWLFGWTVGGGVEVGFWQNWAVRGEYMYTDLEDIDQTVTTQGGTDFRFKHDLDDIQTVKLGITHKF